MAGPYRNPLPTVDIIIEVRGGIVLVEHRQILEDYFRYRNGETRKSIFGNYF